MAFNIDLDRGVHTRQHPGNGMDIHMYVDDPGVYLTSHGTPVDEKLAEQAGFPVEEHRFARKKKLALAAAHARVMEELSQLDKTRIKPTVKERDGFKVIDLGYERHQVLAPDGDVLTKEPLTLRHALILLDQLAPPPPEEMQEPEPESVPAPETAAKAVAAV